MPDAAEHSEVAAFRAAYAPDDAALAGPLLAAAARADEAEARIDARAMRLVEAIRKGSGGLGGADRVLAFFFQNRSLFVICVTRRPSRDSKCGYFTP